MYLLNANSHKSYNLLVVLWIPVIIALAGVLHPATAYANGGALTAQSAMIQSQDRMQTVWVVAKKTVKNKYFGEKKTTSFSYNEEGLVLKEKVKQYFDGKFNGEGTTEYTYENGAVKKAVAVNALCDGNAFGYYTKDYTVKNGRIAQGTCRSSGFSGKATNTYSYKSSNVSKCVYAATGTKFKITSSFTRDKAGRVTRTETKGSTWDTGGVSEFKYDKKGNLKKVHDYSGQLYSFKNTYDKHGRLVKSTYRDYNGTHTTTFVYKKARINAGFHEKVAAQRWEIVNNHDRNWSDDTSNFSLGSGLFINSMSG